MVMIKFLIDEQERELRIHVEQATEFNHDLLSEGVLFCSWLLVFAHFLGNKDIEHIVNPIKNTTHRFPLRGCIRVDSHTFNEELETLDIVFLLLEQLDSELIEPCVFGFLQEIFDFLLIKRLAQIHEVHEGKFTDVYVLVLILDFD